MLGFLFFLCVSFILYSYLGYPIIITVLAHLRTQKNTLPEQKLPLPELYKITFIIAAYNEEDVIASKLDNTMKLDYPKDKLQIIVAADGSDDHTVEIVKQYEDRGITLSYLPERAGKMNAINRAVEQSTGDIIVFSDANNAYDLNALQHLVNAFVDDRVGCAAGSKIIIQNKGNLSNSEGLYWRYESYIGKQETRLGCATASRGEILAVRKSLFIPPAKNIINDDFVIMLSIISQGYQMVYVTDARSYETISTNANEEKIRRARIIAGRYQIMMKPQLLPWKRPMILWQIISHKYTRPLVPFALILAFISNVLVLVFPGESLLTLGHPFNWILFVGQVIFYGFALLGNLKLGKGKLSKILYIPSFLINSNIAALAGLYQYLTHRNPNLWKRVARTDYNFDQVGNDS